MRGLAADLIFTAFIKEFGAVLFLHWQNLLIRKWLLRFTAPSLVADWHAATAPATGSMVAPFSAGHSSGY
jgi:hypothetical protein